MIFFYFSKMPTDTPCYRKIMKHHYSEHRIRRDCKLSWHIENCLDGKNGNHEGFENFWKPCCSELVVKEYKCEKRQLGKSKGYSKNKIKNIPVPWTTALFVVKNNTMKPIVCTNIIL